jgi:nicotinate phosphoribosyltransferase
MSRNILTDKYFTKSKEVAMHAGLNPVVKYRVFSRKSGMAAFAPVKLMLRELCPSAKVKTLPEMSVFGPRDTIMTIEAPFQDIVEFETMYLWWSVWPSYCALKAHKIQSLAKGKNVLDFSNRHHPGAEAYALASYGAYVAGIKQSSGDIGGINSMEYLKLLVKFYKNMLDNPPGQISNIGVGTTPHALLALFGGDYIAMARAYINCFPNDKFVALVDYNNKEIDDTLALLKFLDHKLWGIRLDTCGENKAQSYGGLGYCTANGVSMQSILEVRSALRSNGGDHVKIAVSSGFNEEKTGLYMINSLVNEAVDTIGTGSFIPKVPTATSDIYEVDGKPECKKGREWGYKANEAFKLNLAG